ncbi:MAG: hypothetical protein ACYDBA_14620, partial [Sulfuricaulis sp.]
MRTVNTHRVRVCSIFYENEIDHQGTPTHSCPKQIMTLGPPEKLSKMSLRTKPTHIQPEAQR